MNIINTLHQFSESAKGMLTRFPIAIAFLIALCIQLEYIVITENSLNTLTFFFSANMLLGLLYHICNEDLSRKGKIKALIAYVVSFVVLAIDCIALYKMEDVSASICVAQAVAVFALMVAICFLPFYGEKDDRKSWNFVFSLSGGIAIGCLVGIIMMAGMSFLYYATCSLFDMKSDDNVFATFAIIFLITLPISLFLIRIPQGQQKHSVLMPKNNFVLGVGRFLFLPLVMLYMAVLYFYGAKILFTMTLPKGMVSGLVSALMMGIVSLAFLFYPYLNGKEHKGFEVVVMRRILPAVLPLLVLMSVGIGRRLMDYGITANRLYLITLNVWFYIVAIGLWCNKFRRIHWISISFAAILIVTSCQPMNYIYIGRKIIISRFEKVISSIPVKKKSLSTDDIKKYLLSLPDEEARKQFEVLKDCQSLEYQYFNDKFNNKLYLCGTYDDFMNQDSENVEELKEDLKELSSMSYCYQKDIPVKHGYKFTKYIHQYYNLNSQVVQQEDEYRICDLTSDSLSFYIKGFGTAKIKHKGLDNNQCYAYKYSDRDAIFVVHTLSLNRHDDSCSCELEGYLFYN